MQKPARTSANQTSAIVAPIAMKREGEGTLVPVQVKHQVSSGGVTSTEFSLSLLEAPVPDRSYGSDVCAVQHGRGIVSLCFGQTKASNPDFLHSLLVVRLSTFAFHAFVKSLVEVAHGMEHSIEYLLRSTIVRADDLFIIDSEPEQMVKLTANLGVTAVSNGEACVDFYSASAFSMAMLAAHAQKLAVQPVVRIELPAAQLLGLLDAMKKLQNSIPAPSS